MNRIPRPLVVALVTLALVAVSCGGSESTNLVPIDAPAPGVLYVSTVSGDIQVITPASAAASTLVSGSDADAAAVIDVAPAAGSTGLKALARVPDEPAKISVLDVTAAGLVPIDAPSDSLTCLDPHTDASVPVAHETAGGDQNGVDFSAVTLAEGTLSVDFDLVSVACPRWTADRATVATAIPTRDGDPSSIVTVVQTSAGERHEIGFSGCGSTPTSFSPDDQFLTVALTCYAAAWENSGLYLVPLDGLSEIGDLDALTQLGSGLFGRTAWHPNGAWVATVHADAIENQNIAVDLSGQPVGLQVIELETQQTIDLDLAGGASPFSIAWLASALGS